MKAGDIFMVTYPFVRCTYEEHDHDEYGMSVTTVQSWKPGVEFLPLAPYGEDTEAVCDAEGRMVLTVVDVHKPGRFPARVFYTRSWVDPEGNTFGKGALRITTVPAFRRRSSAYMHEYRIRTAEEVAA